MSKFTRVVGLALILILALGLVSGVGAQDGSKRIVTNRHMPVGDLSNLDPSLADGTDAVQITTELFVELGRLNELSVEVEPGMATWTVSDDGTVYTFDIRDDVPWVRYNEDSGEVEQVLDDDGNVRLVTAADFEFGWKKSLDPLLAATYSGVLAPWATGAQDFFSQGGEADEATRQELMDNIGVRALDDHTLELTVDRASSVVPSIFSMWITVAQPAWVIEEQGDFWIEPENINTYGPFAVKDWTHDESITIVRNPFWPGTDNIPVPAVDEVEFRFIDDEPGFAAFEAGELTYAEGPSGASLDRIKADATLSQAYNVAPGGCSYYYGFNDSAPPFDDARAVQAFSLAIPRESIVEDILKGGQFPAGFFTLFSVGAAPQAADYPDLIVNTDPEMAAAIWQDYLSDTGQSAEDFNLTLLFNTNDTHAAIAQAAQQDWLEILGVEVQLTNQDFGTYLQTRGDVEVANIYRAAWCFDYPDTNNFLGDVFHSVSGTTDLPWTNTEFDALLDQALVEPDVAVRTELYAQAERILIWDDATIAPIYHYTTDDLIAPNLERPGISLIQRDYYEKWDVS